MNFTERNAGTYESPNDFGGTLGKSYALFIVTNEGKRYQSTFEQLEEAPEISRIYNRLGVEEADLATDPVPGVQFFIDVDDASNLATPWKVTGEDGGEVAVVFRDRVISDRIAFQYGTMTPEAAVSDFIAYLDNIRQQLLDAGEDP